MPSRRAVSVILGVGVVYTAVGLSSAELARQAGSHDGVVAWRWAAWVVSAVVFAGQILYEQVRLRSSTKLTALHVAAACGLGAFGLAAAANIHALTATAAGPPLLLVLSLAIWPVMTALPAFVVAYVATWCLARVRGTQP